MHESLDQAIGASPLSTIDVDNVIATARRHTFRRWLSIAASAGGVLATLGVVSALALNPASPRTQNPPNEALPAVQPGQAPARPGETPDQARQRLAAALTDGLTTALPGVGLTDGPTRRPGVDMFFAQTPNTHFSSYSSDVELATVHGKSEVFFQTWAGGRLPDSTAPRNAPGHVNADGSRSPAYPTAVTWFESCAAVPNTPIITGDGHTIVNTCVQRTGPDGQQIVAITQTCPTCTGRPTITHDVYVTWTNAKVALTVTRELKRGTSTASLTAPLLSVEQVITIATNRGLTVTS